MEDARDILQELQDKSPPEQEAYLQRKITELIEKERESLSPQREVRQKTYVVTQEREIKLPAASPADAVRLASPLLVTDPSLNVTVKQTIKETSITAREDY